MCTSVCSIKHVYTGTHRFGQMEIYMGRILQEGYSFSKVVTTLRRSQLMTYLKEYCEYCRIGFLLGPLLVPFPSVNSPNMSVVACQSDRPHPLHLKGLLRLFSKWVYNGYISCGVLKQLRTRSKGTKISPQNARLVNYLASSKLSVFPLVCLQVALID